MLLRAGQSLEPCLVTITPATRGRLLQPCPGLRRRRMVFEGAAMTVSWPNGRTHRGHEVIMLLHAHQREGGDARPTLAAVRAATLARICRCRGESEASLAAAVPVMPVERGGAAAFQQGQESTPAFWRPSPNTRHPSETEGRVVLTTLRTAATCLQTKPTFTRPGSPRAAWYRRVRRRPRAACRLARGRPAGPGNAGAFPSPSLPQMLNTDEPPAKLPVRHRHHRLPRQDRDRRVLPLSGPGR